MFKAMTKTWQIVVGGSVIVTLVAFGFSVAYLRTPDSTPSEPDTKIDLGEDNSLSGCTQIGENNSLQCLVESTDSASVEFEGWGMKYAYFGDMADLSDPPIDDPTDGHHCAQILDWSLSESNVYSPGSLIGAVQASGDSTAAVVGAEVRVLKKEPYEAAALKELTCQYHAGDVYGATIFLDPDSGTARYLPEDADNVSDTRPMPPAAYKVTGGEGYGELAIELGGDEGFIYEGIISVHLRLDGIEKVRTVGTRERPFKWVHADWGDAESFGWNGRTSRWERIVSGFERPGSR